MTLTKGRGTMVGAGVLSAVAASLCCITPLVAMLIGSSSIASNFSWIGAARPYLIGVSVLVLALAWYLKLRPVKADTGDCNCAPPNRSSFWQSKSFLALVTVFAAAMMSFPLYASTFYSKMQMRDVGRPNAATKIVKFTISGMTCAACEGHVDLQLAKVKGVTAFNTDYSARCSVVSYDPTQTNEVAVAEVIERTGYQVIGFEEVLRKRNPK